MRFDIIEIQDRAKKLEIMRECDDAYTISVIGRSFFAELFEKLDRYAVFLGVIADSGENIGYSVLYANDMASRRAFLTLFCIKGNMQRMHLGEALMRESFDAARRRGMTSMALEVLKTDTVPIAFYRRYGFEPTGESSDQFMTMKTAL